MYLALPCQLLPLLPDLHVSNLLLQQLSATALPCSAEMHYRLVCMHNQHRWWYMQMQCSQDQLAPVPLRRAMLAQAAASATSAAGAAQLMRFCIALAGQGRQLSCRRTPTKPVVSAHKNLACIAAPRFKHPRQHTYPQQPAAARPGTHPQRLAGSLPGSQLLALGRALTLQLAQHAVHLQQVEVEELNRGVHAEVELTKMLAGATCARHVQQPMRHAVGCCSLPAVQPPLPCHRLP